MNIRTATENDLEPLSQLLASAFHEDPFHGWFFPCSETRRAKQIQFFALTLRPRILRGAVWMTDDKSAVASWSHPDHGPNPLHFFAAGVRCLSLMGSRAPLAVWGFLKTVRRQPKERHFYLTLLAVDPPLQGRGLGSFLLGSLLTQSDTEQRPVYLEATSERNFRFYQRHGFQLMQTIQLPGHGPTLWLMHRDPHYRA